MSEDEHTARSAEPDRARSGPTGRSGGSRETELIARLRDLSAGPEPDSRFKADLRSQLVSITARVVAEAKEEAATAAKNRTGRRARGRAGTGVLRAARRPLLAFGSAAAVLVLLLGLAVWMSNGALPGQSLYGVKRASENVQLSVAGSDTDKGYTYLQLATNRSKEVGQLLGSSSAGGPATESVSAAGGQISAHTSSLVTDTLSSADADSRSGMQLLGRAAVSQLSADPLAKLNGWLSAQRGRLIDARDRIPAGTLHNRAQASLNLLQLIEARANGLKAKMGCRCLSLANSDALGPRPCDRCGPVLPSPGSSRSSGATPTGSGQPSAPVGSSPGHGGSAPLPSLSLPGLGGGGSGPSTSATGSGAALPTVPTVPGGLPSLPVSTGPGGISTTLPGGVSISIGSDGVTLTVPAIGGH